MFLIDYIENFLYFLYVRTTNLLLIQKITTVERLCRFALTTYLHETKNFETAVLKIVHF